MAFSINTHTVANFSPEKVLTLFKTIEDKAWSFLLDSCAQSHMGGRFDIMVHSPCVTYEFAQGKHSLSGSWTQLSTEKAHKNKPNENATSLSHLFNNAILNSVCPYKNLARLQKTFDELFDSSSISNSEIPFVAGALGVFAYDGNTSSDNIKNDKPHQYGLPDISVGFYHSSIVYDNHTGTLHLFSIESNFIENSLKSIANLSDAQVQKDDFSLLEPWQSNMSKEVYCRQFTKIEKYLRAGDCYQVNFAQRFHAQYYGSEFDAYCRLRLANNAPFSAYVRLPSSTILSLSPERFLSVKDRIVETKPIKGTRKRDPDPVVDKALSDDLLGAEKDRAENLMIVDLLRNDLSKFCKPHSVKVPSLFSLESYPAVHHMVSTVVGELKDDASAYDLMKGAFPGGSITGAPKVRAMQIIQEIEPDKRAIYCGTIGYIGIRGDIDTNICIRTLLAENDKLELSKKRPDGGSKTIYCWAGGGIVLDSNDIDEYMESLHKVAKILPVLEQTCIINTSKRKTIN